MLFQPPEGSRGKKKAEAQKNHPVSGEEEERKQGREEREHSPGLCPEAGGMREGGRGDVVVMVGEKELRKGGGGRYIYKIWKLGAK